MDGWSVMPVLSLNSQKTLLQLARQAIQSRLGGPSVNREEKLPPDFELPRGCFVTLKKHGRLRGCVGNFNAEQPLFDNVRRMALAAAFEDSRFPEVLPGEMGDITIEISVIGEFQKIRDPGELEIGRHGVYVLYQNRKGTYLPEVALEQKWSAEEMIAHCAREKAGLLPHEIPLAEIYLYEVEKFTEVNLHSFP